jgi:hypothetical protein
MTDTPAAPLPVDPWSMTPDQASATLSQMRIDAHPPAPLAPTTPAEARARLNELTSNKEWGKRWVEGGIAERHEYARLIELAADQADQAINNTTPETFAIETIGPGELNRRDLASAVETFRDAGLTDEVINQAMRGGEVSEVSRAEYMAARALKSARLGDEAWVARWSKGGWAEQREMLHINTIVSSFKE